MNISRRRFLKKTIKGATFLTGVGLPLLLKVAAAESSSKPADIKADDAKSGDTRAGDTKAGASGSGSSDGKGTSSTTDGASGQNASGDKNESSTPDKTGAENPRADTSGSPETSEPLGTKLPSLNGRIIRPGDAGYDQSRKNYNGRFDISPKQIFYCENENDVIEAVKWATAEKQKVSIRSGGHSYEAFSLLQDGTVIDISKMTNVQVDSARRTATVSAGTTLLPFYEALWPKGVIVPGGSCATVGVAGLALGGGFGLLSRHMGLACDNLQALRMVDAKGKVIIADTKNNSDLLWACRGGGAGNFGVVTQFTFKVHPIGNVTIVKIRWNWQDMKAVIQAWQKWAPNVDDRFTSVLTLTSKGADHLMFLGLFIGSPAQATALIQPLMTAAKPLKESIETSAFIDAARRFSGVSRPAKPSTSKSLSEAIHMQSSTSKSLSEAIHMQSSTNKSLPETVHIQPHPRFKNSSDYVNADLSEEAIDTIIKFLTNSPIKSSCVQFDSYGGAIARVPEEDSAFCHRAGTKFCMHYQASWGHAADDVKGIGWIDSFRKGMAPFVSGFSYANYCDRAMEDWPHRYYGANLERLNAIKSKYDPEGFFSSPQGLKGKST